MRKYVVDTNCYIDASRDARALSALTHFARWSAPGLFLSSVVAAELRAGSRSDTDRKKLEKQVFGPFARRGRVLTPSPSAWDTLGLTLAALRDEEGLELAAVSRSLAFDVLIAYSCRESGATLITGNALDMERIGRMFAFDYVAPYPEST